MREKTILCFGDSNTWGFPPDCGARYDRQTRWPGVLQQQLGEDYHVIEEGLPGRNTVWDDPVEGGKNGLKQLLPLIHSHMPLDLLIIMLGTNDFKNRFSVSPLDISWSIGRLVKAARDSGHPLLGEAPEVLVLCPPPLADLSSSPFAGIMVGAEEKSRQLAAVLGAFCEDNQIRMFDAGSVVQTSPVDGVHWEPEEHRKLGIAVAEQVQAIL
ncbi:SGNH/GDSL hydrolase family protein [Opitutales bacterium]|nr:SGNH/GDSL hydrolase family protein [Opitutales bacterium]MDB2506831.1 SGNH/GDSL hydrolase family protein [Opitutales bacterium]MDB2682520.1 SGNH/GDSL hydrolase family protein [Opitutales bacterium]